MCSLTSLNSNTFRSRSKTASSSFSPAAAPSRVSLTSTAPSSSANTQLHDIACNSLAVKVAAGGSDGEQAFEELLHALQRRVETYAKAFVPGMEADDLRQELRLTIHHACRKWAVRPTESFVAWANGCMAKRVLQLQRAAGRHKARVLLESVSLHRQVSDRDEADFAGRLIHPAPDPYRVVVRRELVEQAAGDLFDSSNPTARAASPLLLLGLNHSEASAVLRRVGYQTKTGPPGPKRHAQHCIVFGRGSATIRPSTCKKD